MSSVPERGTIEAAYQWDLESVFTSDEAWEGAYDAVEERVEELREREELLEGEGDDRRFPDAETLVRTLELRDDVMREASKIVAFARMRSDEDTRDQHYQAMAARGRSLASAASSAASFIEPAIQALDPDTLDEWVEGTPGLAVYDHYLHEVLRLEPHTRSAEVEEVLSDLGEVLGSPGDIYGMLLDADMTFPTVEHPDDGPVEVTQSNFTTLLKDPDRAFRRAVHEGFYDELGEVRNTVGTSLKNSVKADVKLARIRGYDTAREAALDGPNVPVEVYDTLIDTISDHLGVLHRHAELKREVLGVETLRMWDLYMPLADDEGPEIGYDEATEYVVESVEPLGRAYRDRVAAGLDSRWVDVYENRGKRSGAYSGGTYDTQPFILMNWQGDMASMFTLAHELGHSLHSELASEAQPYVYSDYEIFVAEVASTVHETLLTHHLLETVDEPRFRRHVLNEYLERFRSTLFRQVLFADFERRIHAMEEGGEALTPDRLDETYRELKAAYYEPATVDDRTVREWMRIPHFYYNFYVYQYATGISAAVAIVRRIREEGEDAAAAWRDALELGGSVYPLEVLEHAGLDMTTPDPIEAAIEEYDRQLDAFASLL